MTTGWIVLSEGSRLRWGGDLRRHYLLRPLTRIAGARAGGRWTAEVLRSTLEAPARGRPRLASVEFLDSETDLFVGLFGANPYSDERKTLTIKEFAVTVWTQTPPLAGRAE